MRRILSIGFEWPGYICEVEALDSRRAFHDADVIVFRPGLPDPVLQNLWEERRPSEAFTAKCVLEARRTRTALVLTVGLFEAVQHLRALGNDPAYAAACRQRILAAEGEVVTFPSVDEFRAARASTSNVN